MLGFRGWGLYTYSVEPDPGVALVVGNVQMSFSPLLSTARAMPDSGLVTQTLSLCHV